MAIRFFHCEYTIPRNSVCVPNNVTWLRRSLLEASQGVWRPVRGFGRPARGFGRPSLRSGRPGKGSRGRTEGLGGQLEGLEASQKVWWPTRGSEICLRFVAHTFFVGLRIGVDAPVWIWTALRSCMCFQLWTLRNKANSHRLRLARSRYNIL